MKSIQKLLLAKMQFERNLSVYLKNIVFELKLARIVVELRDGIKIFIRFNNHNQYSYSIIFSIMELDRCRFDNYDVRWEVSTKPHHFHPRFSKEGVSSPMEGVPDKDIPLICDLIKSGKLFSEDLRFSI